MEHIWRVLEGGSVGGGVFTLSSVFLSLLLAFVLGQVLAWVYYFTHSGLSYSKSFVQSLILITIVVAMVMAVIGSSIVTAIGLMGALAIIRFRNIIKDTRDIAFIFCALVVGMATGSQRFAIAISGTLFLSFIMVYLYISDFGTHLSRNGFLRFALRGHIGPGHLLPVVLKRFCNDFTLVSVQESGTEKPIFEYGYQLMIRNPAKNEQMLSELEKVKDIHHISLIMQEQLLEV